MSRSSPISITTKDDNGELITHGVTGWSNITGKTDYAIRRDYKLKQLGARIALRQVVGLDRCEITEAAKAVRILTKKERVIRDHLARSLVQQ